MQKLAEICIRRPVFATMLVLSLIVVGVAGYLRLGIDRFPSVDLPTVRITTTLPGAAPEEMEVLVSQPLEENLNTIEGIRELRSINRQGMSMILVSFELDRKIDVAAQDVRDRVSATLGELPNEINPPVIVKSDNDLSPVMTIALSGSRSQRELTELADKIVKTHLERSMGVGEVEVIGGLERAINVWVDSDRLAAYQVPITAVRDAIVRQNADVPGGNVTGLNQEHMLRTIGRIADPRDFSELVVATRNGSPIRVRDIGWAEDGTKEQRSVSFLNGVPTVTLEIRRQSGANTVAVIEGIKEKMPFVRDAVARRRGAGGYPRPIALHLRGAARDSKAPHPGQHPGLPGRAAVHAQLAGDGHRRGGHPHVGHRHVRHHEADGLHAQQRDDAGAGADGGHSHRRRDRGARKHFPVRRGKADAAV